MLEGRVALVTGAGKEQRGIGRSVALLLAKEGAAVAVGSRTVANAEGVAEEVRASGGRALAIGLDVTVMEQVEEGVKRTIQEFGSVDLLVCNAGITRDNLLMRMTPAEWNDVVQTNLTGAFHCTRAVSRGMVRQRYGRVVYISSVVGLQGNAGQANYAAAKAGLVGLAKATARELGSRNITVNVVAPGFIDTAMTDAIPPEAREQVVNRIPAERFGSPDDVAGAVLFLCGPYANYVTGETLRVDGGLAM
ncbi:MAG TPA: 3-oxoacyl-[acyl-carrier-protein] reductase [Armatimonadota bacterium]|nr:3-oxoacyl-[acyl-carrier-protein] reductase [Armatimonadota bacterium]